jgi:hypothetical protein
MNWISVDKKVPLDTKREDLIWVGDTVLCKDKNGNIFEGRFDPVHREWRRGCFYLGNDTVTHWTELLESPKGE